MESMNKHIVWKFKILLLALSLFSTAQIFAQFAEIKTQLRQLFFDIPIPATKYDVRKVAHSNDYFEDIDESTFDKHDILLCHFTKNDKLSYINNAYQKSFDVWYFKGTDRTYAIGLSLQYRPDFVEDANKQMQEISSFFKSKSFKYKKLPNIVDSIKIGEMIYIFSSAKSLDKGLPYLLLKLSYSQEKEFYFLSATYYPAHFY